MFISSYLHNVDKKGRVFIPAKLRDGLGDKFYISIPVDGQPCLVIYTSDAWNSFNEKIEALPMFQKLAVNRIIGPNTVDVECDSQGRVLIPQHLRSFASLDDSAYIVGTGETIEIWSKDVWDKKQSEMTLDQISSTLSKIDF